MYENKLLLWNTFLCECGSEMGAVKAVHMQPLKHIHSSTHATLSLTHTEAKNTFFFSVRGGGLCFKSDHCIVIAPTAVILYISTLAFVTINPLCLFLYISSLCYSSCPPSVTYNRSSCLLTSYWGS